MSIPTVFEGEVQLAGWSESHNGGAKVTLWLSDPADLDAFRSLTARKGNTAGQRLACVLVEIGDGGEPVRQDVPAAAPPAPEPEPEPELKGGQLARLAGRWCGAADFRAWLANGLGVDVPDAEAAAVCIRQLCGVESRAELDHDAGAARLFHERIRRPYSAHLNAHLEA